MNHQLVMIEWHDSRQPLTEWRYLSDVKDEGPVICRSVGWLISDGDTKLVCQTIGDAEGGSAQGLGMVQIPARSVINVSVLAAVEVDRDECGVLVTRAAFQEHQPLHSKV